MSKSRLFGNWLPALIFCCSIVGCGSQSGTPAVAELRGPLKISTTPAAPPQVKLEATSGLAAPIRLEADGKPIDIGELSSIAHAGPWIADIDDDGDRDLLVGDFPGHFWLFDNVGSESKPEYTSKGKLQAGGVDAKTPVY